MYIRNRRVLGKPIDGWTSIDLDGLVLRASYLTNVPFDILSAARQYYETGAAGISFDAESFEYMFRFSYKWFTIHFPDLYEWGGQPLYLDDITPEEFFACALRDLEKDLPGWAQWVCDMDDGKGDLAAIESRLQSEIKNTRALIKQKEAEQ